MWNWLKNLWNSAKNLVAKIFEAFLNWIIYMIEVVYISFVTSVILTHFTYVYLLYVLFYVASGDAFMEVWNPRESQPRSKVINLGKAPPGTNKPSREQADVLIATREK